MRSCRKCFFSLPNQLALLFFLQHINVMNITKFKCKAVHLCLQKNSTQSARRISHYSRQLDAARNGRYGIQICRRKHDSKATVHNWPLIMRDPGHSQVFVLRCRIFTCCLTQWPWLLVWKRSETSSLLRPCKAASLLCSADNASSMLSNPSATKPIDGGKYVRKHYKSVYRKCCAMPTTAQKNAHGVFYDASKIPRASESLISALSHHPRFTSGAYSPKMPNTFKQPTGFSWICHTCFY